MAPATRTGSRTPEPGSRRCFRRRGSGTHSSGVCCRGRTVGRRGGGVGLSGRQRAVAVAGRLVEIARHDEI